MAAATIVVLAVLGVSALVRLVNSGTAPNIGHPHAAPPVVLAGK